MKVTDGVNRSSELAAATGGEISSNPSITKRTLAYHTSDSYSFCITSQPPSDVLSYSALTGVSSLTRQRRLMQVGHAVWLRIRPPPLSQLAED
jgi:hypothetical protein